MPRSTAGRAICAGRACVLVPISRVDRAVSSQLLFAPGLRGRTSTEATYPMMIQTHSFREQPAIIRKIIAFVMIAIVLYLLLGPIGILYALGFGTLFLLIYLLTTAFAALLDPDVY